MTGQIFNEKAENLIVYDGFGVLLWNGARPQVRGKGLKEQGVEGLLVTSPLVNWSIGDRPPMFF
jgi:hypothetical protein